MREMRSVCFVTKLIEEQKILEARSRDARIKSAIETTSDAAGRDHACITLKA